MAPAFTRGNKENHMETNMGDKLPTSSDYGAPLSLQDPEIHVIKNTVPL